MKTNRKWRRRAIGAQDWLSHAFAFEFNGLHVWRSEEGEGCKWRILRRGNRIVVNGKSSWDSKEEARTALEAYDDNNNAV